MNDKRLGRDDDVRRDRDCRWRAGAKQGGIDAQGWQRLRCRATRGQCQHDKQ